MPAEEAARRGRLGRSVPSQGSGTPRRQLRTSSKKLDGRRSETLVLAEKAFRVKQRIESIGEKTGMAAYASQNEAILILNLSLDHTVAEGCIVLGRRNRRSPISRRSKAGAGHGQGSKNLPRAEALQFFSGDDFKRAAQQDKSRIGVLRVASGDVSRGSLRQASSNSSRPPGRSKNRT